MEKEIKTIQKNEKLNDVYVSLENGGNHTFIVKRHNSNEDICTLHFQEGPRNLSDSIEGIIDSDLLEIVKYRLETFQNGKFKSHYIEEALFHIVKALESLNNRVEDRINRNVL